MANVLVRESSLEAIADAIREKLNTEDTYKPGEMADAIKSISGGGGSSPVINPLSVTENGIYTAPSGVDGYSPVTVNVPNTYSAGDEGKVVSNGALVAQTSDTVTSNGTVDTTLINSLLVNVSGGSGGSAVTGTITPSENTRTLTISDIIGKSNVLIFPTTDNPSSVSTRTHWGALFLNGRCILVGSSNSGGSSYTMVASWTPASSETSAKDVLDTTTGTITINTGAGSNYGGYFVSSITYQYVAW